ncbi:MAG TPA: hypothetical protein EYG38_17610, partial [Verrucomicrobia bacterium]|nr:hypothetical protein [Verrucomicrobiota bacterium]
MTDSRKPGRFNQRFGKPILALAATLLGLLAAEGFVRLSRKAPEIKPIELSDTNCVYQRSTNAILGFELKSNYRNSNPDFIESYERTNSHGQRDRKRVIQKPEGVQRIILLGDSVVEGHGLAEDQTLSHLLEQLYENQKTEVLNFGVSAYCTLAEIELLETKGLQFDPDVVILIFVENDFDNFNREAFPLNGTLDRPALAKSFFKNSHLFRMVSIQMNLFGFEAEADPVAWNKTAIGDNNVVEGLRRFRQLANQHGFQPLVVVWPRFLNDRLEDPLFIPGSDTRLIVEHLAADNQIPSVRLSRFFREDLKQQPKENRNPRLLYSSGDELHPSKYGSHIAAQALKNILDTPERYLKFHESDSPLSSDLDRAALEAAEKLGTATPNYARVHHRVGVQHLKAGELDEAIGEFKKTLSENPKHAGAHNNLGLVYERMDRRTEALNHFKAATDLESDFVQAHFN